MATLAVRTHSVLGGALNDPWESLMRLFQSDPEGFYLLSCADVNEFSNDREIQRLCSYATRIRQAVRRSYSFDTVGGESYLISDGNRWLPIPADLVEKVSQFLREVDGKTIGDAPGKDYEGKRISEAEMRFKLGPAESWKAEQDDLAAKLENSPFLLTVLPEELDHLATQPAYVRHGLLNAARKTVLAPMSVFRGMGRGGHCSPDLADGWAFCGKPRMAHSNVGEPFAPPPGFVYMVYADRAGRVFDWDWVKENPDEAGMPIDWQLRFDRPVELESDVILTLPLNIPESVFDAATASYSSRGDCIFCYISDACSYAERINPDLTVFRRFDNEEVTGFKVKNVRRILENDRSIVIDDAPGITVAVDSILLASLKLNPHEGVRIYKVVIQSLYKRAPETPTVRLPCQDDCEMQVVDS